MRGEEVLHQATVQCCPQCNNGMAWDSMARKHVPRDEYDYKHWQGPSKDLLRRFREAVEGKWEPEVCSGNAYRLIGMVKHEMRMVGLLRDDLKQGNTPAFPHLFDQDVAEMEALLKTWAGLVKRAKAKFPEIPEVANA